MRTNATPTNVYRYTFFVKVAPKQANAVAKEVHCDSMLYDFNMATIIEDMAISINRIFKIVFMLLRMM